MNQEPVRVTVITVVYNGAQTIKDSIESVLNQTVKPIEYIIIDGLSTDNTLSIVQSYQSKFKDYNIDLVVVSEKDSGIYNAMNKGIKMASGDLIGILNADDWYEKETIQRVSQAHEQNPKSIKYGMLKMYKNGQLYHVKMHTIEFLDEHMPQHPTWFVPKFVYTNVGLFDEKYRVSADYDFAQRAKRAGTEFTAIEAVLSNFRIGGATVQQRALAAAEITRIKHFYGINTGLSASAFFTDKFKKMIQFIKISTKK